MTGKTEEIKAHKPYKMKGKKPLYSFFSLHLFFPCPGNNKKNNLALF